MAPTPLPRCILRPPSPGNFGGGEMSKQCLRPPLCRRSAHLCGPLPAEPHGKGASPERSAWTLYRTSVLSWTRRAAPAGNFHEHKSVSCLTDFTIAKRAHTNFAGNLCYARADLRTARPRQPCRASVISWIRKMAPARHRHKLACVSSMVACIIAARTHPNLRGSPGYARADHSLCRFSRVVCANGYAVRRRQKVAWASTGSSSPCAHTLPDASREHK